MLGISLFDGKGEAGAGAFLDLPTIKATVSQVAHANSKCELVSNSTKTNDVIESLFDSLTKIVPEVDLDLGLVAQAGVHAGDFAVNGVKKYTALSTHYSLPTACLSFDGQAKTFGPAVAALASATGKQGTDKGGKNAAEGLVNPFTGLLGGHWRLQAVILTLAFMFGCFMGL